MKSAQMKIKNSSVSEENSFSSPHKVKLRVTDLHHAYGTLEVLQKVSFEIREGELLGFLGPNGAGKTTVFQILCGLLKIQKGSFFLNGGPIHPTDEEFRKSLGVVFQQPSLDLKLSALENLILSAKLYRIPKTTAKKRALELMAFMDLKGREQDRVETFSGGMKQRLEIIRALIHGPDFLILDEPTQGLDEAGFRKIWTRLLDLRKQSPLTMLLTTHRADEAERCDRLIILNEGKIIANDTPDNLMNQIGGDVLVLEFPAQSGTDRIQQVKTKLEEELNLNGKMVDGKILLEIQKAHLTIPKIVEHFPEKTFSGINIHRPTLGDVFLHLTGKKLVP